MKVLIAPIFSLVVAVAAVGCFDPGEVCHVHCWQHTQDVNDIDNDDYIDDVDAMNCTAQSCPAAQCVNWWTSNAIDVPMPTLGSFHGKACNDTQSEFEDVKKVIDAIVDGAIDAENECDPSELATYADFVEELAAAAKDQCVKELTCDGDFFPDCDIDLSVAGKQACTVASAEDVCAAQVEALALAALSELDDETPGAAQPQPAQVEEKVLGQGQSCDFQWDIAGSGGPEDVCAEEGGGGAEGADSTGGMMSDPFGDVDLLMDCSALWGYDAACWVDEELLWNLEDNFTVFYQEGVALTLVNLSGAGWGAQISGLNSGEASKDLADALGLQNGDLITSVNGISLSSTNNALNALGSLQGAQSAEFTVKRQVGRTWTTLDYYVYIPVS